MILQEATESDMSDPCMHLAAKEAEKSTQRFKLGAAIKSKKSRISAHNTRKTHTKLGSGRYNNLHAEGYAILKAKSNGVNLVGATIYVYRDGGLNSKPCADCERIIRAHGIKRVIYTHAKERDTRKIKEFKHFI